MCLNRMRQQTLNTLPEYGCPAVPKVRLVHRQDFALPEAEATVEELSVDGGNIRIRTLKGQPCVWQGYKAVCLHELSAIAASFQSNAVGKRLGEPSPLSRSIDLSGGWT